MLKRNGKVRKMIKIFFIIILIFGVLVLLLLFYVWERVTAMQLTLVLAEKQRKSENVKNVVEKLRLEYLKLTSVSRIERIAKDELKMQYPTSKEVRYIIEDR